MLKKVTWIIAVTICIISLLALGLATISSVIYFIYLWGSAGLSVGEAAWEGVKTWLTIIGIGVPTTIVTYFTAKATE